MKKLFLSSSFEDVANLLEDFLGENLTGKTITFIPTASQVEEVTFYVDSAKKAFEKMGILVDELDVATATNAEISDKLKKNDYIYVSGGNTFYLLQELRKSGADKIINEEINTGKLYIGESAGSVILSPNIEYIRDMDDCSQAPELNDFSALQSIDFYPLPHYKNFPFAEAADKIVSTYESKLQLHPFSNNQVILVKGENIIVKSK